MTRDEMIAEVEQLNGAQYDPTDKTSQAILFLIASIECGTNYQKIQQVTGLPMLTCRHFARFARGMEPGTSKQPLWRGRKIDHGGWDDPETGGIAILMDAMVLSGLMERTLDQRTTSLSSTGRGE